MGQMGVRNTQLYIDSVNGGSQIYAPSSLCPERPLNRINQMMAYHPQYQEPFTQTQEFIMQGDGPLPYDQRYYIALMAAARHQCIHLAEIATQEYLSYNGDKTWLQGLEFAPKKIRDLDEINTLLAHRPWMVTKHHILKLTTGNDNWSLAEVVHAIVILAHFHALSSFVFGCGLSQQALGSGLGSSSPKRHNGSRESLKSGQSSPRGSPPSPSTSSSPPSSSPSPSHSHGIVGSVSPSTAILGGGEVESLMRKMRTISESKSSQQDITYEELARRFESEASESANINSLNGGRTPPRNINSHHSTTTATANSVGSSQNTPGDSVGIITEETDLTRFVTDPSFGYQDFTKRDLTEIPTFRIQDYSWDDHGYSLVNRLYNDVGKLLDKKFKVAYNMTYYTMGGKINVDTSMFRRAVWNYIHCLFGIRHDDYDYREVNELLDRNLKQYIKAVCCHPDRVSKQHYDNVMREFKYSEKVHVTLMILEARMQAELLYALRALMRHMT